MFFLVKSLQISKWFRGLLQSLIQSFHYTIHKKRTTVNRRNNFTKIHGKGHQISTRSDSQGPNWQNPQFRRKLNLKQPSSPPREHHLLNHNLIAQPPTASLKRVFSMGRDPNDGTNGSWHPCSVRERPASLQCFPNIWWACAVQLWSRNLRCGFPSRCLIVIFSIFLLLTSLAFVCSFLASQRLETPFSYTLFPFIHSFSALDSRFPLLLPCQLELSCPLFKMFSKPFSSFLVPALLLSSLAEATQVDKRSVGALTPLSSKTKVCNILNYGAVADNKTDIGPAIKSAFSSCAITGGATIYIPPGSYSRKFFSQQLRHETDQNSGHRRQPE